MNISIENKNGQLVVDSRLVADNLGIEHRSFFRTIKNYEDQLMENFGAVRFEIAPRQDENAGGDQPKFCYLTEDQASFLMTLSRNTQQVVQAKLNLVKAFSEAKRLLQEEQQKPYLSGALAETVMNVIDVAFKDVGINKALIAGCKLNAASKILPPEANAALDEGRKLLASTTTIPDRLLTATELGKEIGLSARKVNKLLIEKGLQIKNPDKKSKSSPTYLPTERGSEFCDFTIATGKSGDNTSFQQLKWYPLTLRVIDL